MHSTDPKPVIEVVEEGARQRVRVRTPQHGFHPYDNFLTDWPADLLLALANLKCEWFADSYARFEHPNYIQKQVDLTLQFYNLSLRDRRVLDFGCGFGASSYCLMKRGADHIVATDLVRENTDFAKLFFTKRGLAQYIDVPPGRYLTRIETGRVRHNLAASGCGAPAPGRAKGVSAAVLGGVAAGRRSSDNRDAESVLAQGDPHYRGAVVAPVDGPAERVPHPPEGSQVRGVYRRGFLPVRGHRLKLLRNHGLPRPTGGLR